MAWLEKLERKLGWLEVTNLTLYLLIGQIVGFVLLTARPEAFDLFVLRGANLVQGEVWRLFSFWLLPATMSPLWLVFELYLLYLYGRMLERRWGDWQFTAYMLLGWVATIVGSLLVPNAEFTNVYLLGSVFFAFAYLYPDFVLQLLFIFPVKIKWLALVAGIGLVIVLLSGAVATKIAVLSGMINWLLFFGKDVFVDVRYWLLSERKSKRGTKKSMSGMKCGVCGTEDAIFYYCETCIPEQCYCEDHIKDHEHVKVH